jgi:hypothetical protein
VHCGKSKMKTIPNGRYKCISSRNFLGGSKEEGTNMTYKLIKIIYGLK